MKKFLLLIQISLLITFLNLKLVYAGDTFSIVAVDPVTGQVGSAGASCIAGAIILSDVHPGVGAIHTQAYYLAQNQNYARSLMNLGLSPQQIIDSVVAHDAQNNPTIRQYGIVDLVGGGRSAAYTGVNCDPYKNHITGPTYSIQGNILLGQQILDSMKSRFLNTPGQLAVKLMAALQGAKVIGADTRCLNRGTSSISAFIRVANPNDPVNNLYLDLNVNNTPVGRDPIDSLQVLFNNWLATGIIQNSSIIPDKPALYQNYPNPFNPVTTIKFDIPKQSSVKIIVYDILGNQVTELVNLSNVKPGSYSVQFDAGNLASGIYLYKIIGDNFTETKKMLVVK